MSSCRTLGAAAACALILSGCAPQPYRPLGGDRDAIRSTDVVQVVPHSELGADIDAADNAEDLAASLRHQLILTRFSQFLAKDLDQALAGVKYLGALPLKTLGRDDPDSLKGELTASKAGAVLFIKAGYGMSPDFSTLQLQADAWLEPRSARYRGTIEDAPEGDSVEPAEAAYHNTLTVTLKAAGTGEVAADNVQVWSRDHAAQLRGAVAHGAQQLAALVALDLQAQGQDDAAVLQTATPVIRNGTVKRNETGGLDFAATVDPGDVVPPATAVAVIDPPPPPPPPPPAPKPAPVPAAPKPVVPPVAAAPAAKPAAAKPAGAKAAPAPTQPAGPQAPRVPRPAPATLKLESPANVVNRPTREGAAVATIPAGETVEIVSSMTNAAGYWLMVKGKDAKGWLRAEPVKP